MDTESFYPRFILPRLRAALADTPAVLIHGPRQCGKTTLARMVGGDYAYFTFDDENVLASSRRDPVGFVERLPKRVVLDEVQRVPELFATLKHAIDRDRTPGRFLLTGSANLMLLPRLSDSLAGRMEVLMLYPLAQCEIEGRKSSFLEQVLEGKLSDCAATRLGEELVERVLKGGYPEPRRRASESRRQAWLRNYVETILQRDIHDIARISSMEAVPTLLQMLAQRTGQLLNISELAKAFQLSRPTIDHYVALLRRIFLVDFLQPWHSNRSKRLIKTPKVHLADTGLAAMLLGVDARQLRDNQTAFGHLLETFVYEELRKQASWLDDSPAFYHFRDRDLHEVDIVMEDRQGRLVAVEVKAAGTVFEKDFTGLRCLQRLAGKRFRLGLLLYDGEHLLPFGNDLLAVPISALWRAG